MSEQEPDQKTPKTKAEIIKEVAGALSERRNARRISLEAASRSLKIRVTFLDALEKAQWDQLPGDVYVRGFVVRYAQYLGLDGPKLLSPYVNFVAERKRDKAAVEVSPEEASRSSWIWVGLGILLMIGLVKFFKPQNPVELPPKEPIEKPVPHESAPGTASSEEDSAAAEHRLEIFSINPLWLRVKTDRKSFEGFITQNATWSFKGDGMFEIKLGHTKQVALWFDKGPVPLAENQKIFKLPK